MAWKEVTLNKIRKTLKASGTECIATVQHNRTITETDGKYKLKIGCL